MSVFSSFNHSAISIYNNSNPHLHNNKQLNLISYWIWHTAKNYPPTSNKIQNKIGHSYMQNTRNLYTRMYNRKNVYIYIWLYIYIHNESIEYIGTQTSQTQIWKKRKICTFKLENSFLGWKCFPLFCVCTMYYMCSDSLSKKCLADWSLWWGWTDILQNIFRYFTGFCLCERIIKKWNTFFSIHTNFLL